MAELKIYRKRVACGLCADFHLRSYHQADLIEVQLVLVCMLGGSNTCVLEALVFHNTEHYFLSDNMSAEINDRKKLAPKAATGRPVEDIVYAVFVDSFHNSPPLLVSPSTPK